MIRYADVRVDGTWRLTWSGKSRDAAMVETYTRAQFMGLIPWW